MAPRAFVLASASPRRKRLLEEAGYGFSIDVPDVDERIFDGEDGLSATLRLAWDKSRVVCARSEPGSAVLAADTTVICGGRVLGKPAGREAAVDMLMSLSGRNHRVITGWVAAVAGDPRQAVSGVTSSVVRMRDVRRSEAIAYVASGEPLDKAGAYAVQGSGRRLVGAVLGSRDNVIGLPVAQVGRALASFGVVPSA